jgi:uncharacterized protein (TIGR00299 family) protein
MRIAYLECFSGISGDMFLGALLDAGVPARVFHDTVAALNLGATLEIARVIRGGISATKLDVVVGGEKDLPREVYQAQKRAGGYVQLAAAPHPRRHGAGHEHEHPPHPRDTAHGRTLNEIRAIISRAAISETAKQRAIAIFENLGAAESKIHNVPAEQVHFHEAGAVDAIVDIVCAAAGSEALSVNEWVCSPLNVGGGTVECAHGTIPIPAPATVELLSRRGAPFYSSGIQKELVTPTGAAIVSVLASRFDAFPAMKVAASGYGAGSRDLPGWPNVVRITVGEAHADADKVSAGETVTVLEANIDDLSPQVFGYLMERALAAGALDIFTTPVQMKKSRPGLLLTVLCKPEDREQLARLIFAETTTLGIRMRDERRYCLLRQHVTVNTAWGDVRLKLAHLNGNVTNYAPEYEDCRRIALEHKVPLKTVIHEAIRLYLERKHEP